MTYFGELSCIKIDPSTSSQSGATSMARQQTAYAPLNTAFDAAVENKTFPSLSNRAYPIDVIFKSGGKLTPLPRETLNAVLHELGNADEADVCLGFDARLCTTDKAMMHFRFEHDGHDNVESMHVEADNIPSTGEMLTQIRSNLNAQHHHESLARIPRNPHEVIDAIAREMYGVEIDFSQNPISTIESSVLYCSQRQLALSSTFVQLSQIRRELNHTRHTKPSKAEILEWMENDRFGTTTVDNRDFLSIKQHKASFLSKISDTQEMDFWHAAMAGTQQSIFSKHGTNLTLSLVG